MGNEKAPALRLGLPVDTASVDLDSHAVEAFAYPVDTAHERCVECFGVGWHARDTEVAELRRQLEQANADADRFYRIAFDTPGTLRARLDAGAADYWREFIGERV